VQSKFDFEYERANEWEEIAGNIWYERDQYVKDLEEVRSKAKYFLGHGAGSGRTYKDVVADLYRIAYNALLPGKIQRNR